MVMTDGPMSGKAQKVMYTITATPTFVDGVESFSLSYKAGTAETTCALTGQDLTDKTFIGTLREWSGSIKLKFVNFGDAAQLALWNAVGDTVPVTCEFYYDAATKATGTIIVTGFDVDEAIDGVASGSVSFTGSASLTPSVA
jgi:hypothetical protein